MNEYNPNFQQHTINENAADSLEEAVNFLEKSVSIPRKIRLTIILLENFIELFLKTYIASKHPLLIYQTPSNTKSPTIGIQEALLLFEKLGLVLPKPLLKEIIKLKKMRNPLHHFEANLITKEWEERIGKIIYYFLLFDEGNGNIFNIKSFVSLERWQKIVYLKDIYETHLDYAIQEAKAASFYGPNDDPPPNMHPECPKCGIYETTQIENDRQSAYCHFCRDKFPINQCSLCSDFKYANEYYYTEDGVITDCCAMCASTL